MDEITNRSTGERAEEFAFRYLVRQGLIPVTRNFRTRRGEIDLIMREKRCVVCVEVRFRSNRSLVAAHLTVNRRKQTRIAMAAAVFLARNPVFRHHRFRFDVIGINRKHSGDLSLNWLQDAFRPG